MPELSDQAPDPPVILMVGLPSSGKTTLLAAVWYALREPDSQAELVLGRLPASVDSLNKLVTDWLSCTQADHTTTAAVSANVLVVRTRENADEFTLAMPDYSGEHVMQAWVRRSWPGRLATYVRNAAALILLVHPSYTHDRVTVGEAMRNAAALEAEPPTAGRPPRPFDRAEVPSTTVLVEFLQFARSRTRRKLLRVAVVISAWDEVANDGLTPPEWLRLHMPLLYQFLAMNPDSLPSAAFGISAQGGSWPAERARLLALEPVARPRVVAPDGNESTDVTSPIAWVLADS